MAAPFRAISRDQSVTRAEPERGWLYGRVSDDHAGYSSSVPDQETYNEEIFTAAGAVIERRYSDEDRSASRFAKKRRDDWERLLSDLRTLPPPDFIGFWKIDRADRTVDSWAPFLTLCRKLGVKLKVAKGRRTFDPAEHIDRKWLLAEGIDAEGASEEISHNVRRGIASSAARGKPHGPALYGYTRRYDSRGRLAAVEKNEFEAAIIHEIHWRVGRNESPLKICADLDRRGIPTPRAAQAARELDGCEDPGRRAVLEARLTAKWATTTIKTIVENRSYTAERIAHGERVADAMWPPIVTATLAIQARAVIRERSETGRRPGRNKYLQSFITECGICRQPIQGKPTYGKTEAGQSGEYWCKTSGTHPRRRIPLLDAYLTEAVIARLAQPDIMRHLGAGEDARREIENLTAGIKEKEQRLQDAIDSHALNGTPTLAAVTQMEALLIPAINADRDRLRRLTVSPLLDGLTGIPVEAIRSAWETLDLGQKRAVIRLLTVRIELRPAGRARLPLRETVTIVWRQAEDEDDQ